MRREHVQSANNGSCADTEHEVEPYSLAPTVTSTRFTCTAWKGSSEDLLENTFSVRYVERNTTVLCYPPWKRVRYAIHRMKRKKGWSKYSLEHFHEPPRRSQERSVRSAAVASPAIMKGRESTASLLVVTGCTSSAFSNSFSTSNFRRHARYAEGGSNALLSCATLSLCMSLPVRISMEQGPAHANAITAQTNTSIGTFVMDSIRCTPTRRVRSLAGNARVPGDLPSAPEGRSSMQA